MSYIIRCSKTRRLTLRVVSCGPATKALNKAFINLPTAAPARGRGEDSVGVNADVLCSKSSQRLATFRSNKIGLLGSEKVRFLVSTGNSRK